MRRYAILMALCALAAACDPAGEERILDIDAFGTVDGIVFLDLDASSTPGAADVPAANLLVALVREGSSDTVADVRTDVTGLFVFPIVEAGTYEVVVPPSSLGDSLRVVYRDPPGSPVEDIGPGEATSITVGRDDSVSVVLGVGHHIVTVEEARALPNGRRAFVRGVALTSIGALGDTALYMQGDTRGLRATRVTGDDLLPGDSVLALGTIATRDGQPVLLNAIARLDGTGGAIDTLDLGAGTARTAGGGVHDARLALLEAVLVTDTATVGSRFTITVEDPSGTVVVSVPVDFDLGDIAPGDELDVLGVLVPAPGIASTWQIRPRSSADVTLLP